MNLMQTNKIMNKKKSKSAQNAKNLFAWENVEAQQSTWDAGRLAVRAESHVPTLSAVLRCLL